MSVRVKLCGLRDAAAVSAASRGKPEAVGFVLAPSVRQVDLAVLDELLSPLPGRVERWAVFRDPDPEIVRALAHLDLTGVQGHAGWDGDGLPERMAFLPVFLDGPDLLDRVRGAGFDGRHRAVRGFTGAFLLDGPKGGGAGVRADLDRAAEAAKLGPMVLAGGLRPDTVEDAVRRVLPYGVDVSSGTESAPGVKDPEAMRAFAAAARAGASRR